MKQANKNLTTREKGYRSLVKAISWRTMGTIDTIFISWIIVGDINFAVSIGGVELFTKMILYYLHERIWSRSKLGLVKEVPIEFEI